MQDKDNRVEPGIDVGRQRQQINSKRKETRAKLLALGSLLKSLESRGAEELIGDARLAQIYAECRITNPEQLATVFKWSIDLVNRVDNWCDYMRPRMTKSEPEADKIIATCEYLREYRMVVQAQGTPEDVAAVTHTIELLDDRGMQFLHTVSKENSSFEKEIIEPILQAATSVLEALNDLVDFLTSLRPS